MFAEQQKFTEIQRQRDKVRKEARLQREEQRKEARLLREKQRQSDQAAGDTLRDQQYAQLGQMISSLTLLVLQANPKCNTISITTEHAQLDY